MFHSANKEKKILQDWHYSHHTTAVYVPVLPSTDLALHIADTFMLLIIAQLRIALKPWSKELSNDMLL